MGLTSLPLFSALSDKMRWHQQRQSLLAQNVANAETPGYRGQDLRPFTVERAEGQLAMTAPSGAAPGHIALAPIGGATGFAVGHSGFAVTPGGNSVTLEDEMMKVTGNQMDYQAVTTLYTRSMRLLKTALGRSA